LAMEQAVDHDQLWEALIHHATELGFEWIDLELSDLEDVLRWRRTGIGNENLNLQALDHRVIPLQAGTRELGVLKVAAFREHQVFMPMFWCLCQVLGDGVTLGLLRLEELERSAARGA